MEQIPKINDLQTFLIEHIKNKLEQIKLKDYHTNWFNNLDYALKRQDEYPPFQDYLDAIVKNDAVQLQKYIDDCLAVKAKYPKQ